MAQERKSLAEMIGEFLRELALLLLVFVPLDWVFRAGGRRFWFELEICVAVAVVVLTIGLMIELRGD
jgi:hypothetical protein